MGQQPQKEKGLSNYVISLNKYLDQIYTGLLESHRLLMAEKKVAIKARLFGGTREARHLSN
ncbi:hypothetical protein [Maribacter cobaltidurans]|uniref:hypothetical protein n=1 Tax=Maribacter cobaltidurans TaxID=1178778 RepID=UPI00199C8932|nr:hypothetical protein [Maribacter cobaltidurans]GGD93691.1 hypothetical protein GCM10011412_34630 [Maribacter cobaltidurans]